MLWRKGQMCFVCQKEIKTFEESTLEHIVPKSLGGTLRSRNLALSHKTCNSIRGAILCRIVWELKLKKYHFAKEMQKAWRKKMYERKEDLAPSIQL